MQMIRENGQGDFPLYGARARNWRRFENELHLWMASPEGRFAIWRAERCLASDAVAHGPESLPPTR